MLNFGFLKQGPCGNLGLCYESNIGLDSPLIFYAEVEGFQARSWASEPKEGLQQRGGRAGNRRGEGRWAQHRNWARLLTIREQGNWELAARAGWPMMGTDGCRFGRNNVDLVRGS